MFRWLRDWWSKDEIVGGGIVPKKEHACILDDLYGIYSDCYKKIFKCKECGKETTIKRDFHDWEIVDEGEYTCRSFGENNKVYRKKDSELYKQDINSSYFSLSNSVDKVCLRCGECYHGIDEMKDKYLEQEKFKVKKAKEKQDRVDLAKRMFKDGCDSK